MFSVWQWVMFECSTISCKVVPRNSVRLLTVQIVIDSVSSVIFACVHARGEWGIGVHNSVCSMIDTELLCAETEPFRNVTSWTTFEPLHFYKSKKLHFLSYSSCLTTTMIGVYSPDQAKQILKSFKVIYYWSLFLCSSDIYIQYFVTIIEIGLVILYVNWTNICIILIKV